MWGKWVYYYASKLAYVTNKEWKHEEQIEPAVEIWIRGNSRLNQWMALKVSRYSLRENVQEVLMVSICR